MIRQVGAVQVFEVLVDQRELSFGVFQLLLRECDIRRAVLRVYGADGCTVDADALAGEDLQIPACVHEQPEHLLERGPVLHAEVRDGVMIRAQFLQ